MRKIALAALLAATALTPATLFAGPYQDFETQLHTAYQPYRTALLKTGVQDAESSPAQIAAFANAWSALVDQWKLTPPPQYADDPEFGETLDTVSAAIDEATALVADGNLGDAHLALEKVRDALGDLHSRNGIQTYTDRVNAYHAQMEMMLQRDYAGENNGLARLREDAAVLAYLSGALGAHEPAEADHLVDGAKFLLLHRQLAGSVDAVLAAVDTGNFDAAMAALAALKPTFAKFFVNFG